MISAYAVKCRFSDVGLIRNALEGVANVKIAEPNTLDTVQPPPDMIFFGWGGGQDILDDTDMERKIRNLATSTILIRKIHQAVAFRDVPILCIIEHRDTEQAVFCMQQGASDYIIAPLDERKIRQAVEEAMRPAGEHESKIDVNLVNPFVNATVLVMERMAGVRPQKTKVLLKKDYRLFGEISALIGITGEGMEGAVGITFRDDLAREVVSKMWNRPSEQLDRDDINDGLGELVNVICGQATTQMSKNTSRDFSLALPSIITGFGHIITQRSDTPCLVIVFEADEKPFAVQVAISMK